MNHIAMKEVMHFKMYKIDSPLLVFLAFRGVEELAQSLLNPIKLIGHHL